MAVVQLDFVGHQEISLQKAFARAWLYNTPRYSFLAPNIQLLGYGFESDLIGIRKSGFVDEIEIKRTVSDFRADFKKTNYSGTRTKHAMLAAGELIPNYFYFYTTDDVYEKIKDEIPDHAGVAVMMTEPNRWQHLYEAKPAPRLHREYRIDESGLIKLGNKMMHRFWREVG